MSAYLCDNHHLAYLAAAAVRLPESAFGYRSPSGESRRINRHDWKAAAALANLLQRQNLASLSARYPDEPKESPEPVRASEIPRIQPLDPVQVLLSCDCYEYQACETPDWRKTEACSVIDEIRKVAIASLPGYDEAIWGAPHPA